MTLTHLSKTSIIQVRARPSVETTALSSQPHQGLGASGGWLQGIGNEGGGEELSDFSILNPSYHHPH